MLQLAANLNAWRTVPIQCSKKPVTSSEPQIDSLLTVYLMLC